MRVTLGVVTLGEVALWVMMSHRGDTWGRGHLGRWHLGR